MIIGPYKADGTTWGCDRDVCNGNFIDGSYDYVGSDQFPYVVGCWGPGPDPAYGPTCSTNACSARSTTSQTTTGSSTTTGGSTSDDTMVETESAFETFASASAIFVGALAILI